MYSADDYRNDSNGSGFAMGLLCGAALGAALGLLLAPKAGTELRGQLLDSANRVRRRANDTYEQASSAVADVVEQGRRAVRRGREKFEEAKTAFSEEVEAGQEA